MTSTKKYTLAAIGILSLGLAACGTSAENTDGNTQADTPTATSSAAAGTTTEDTSGESSPAAESTAAEASSSGSIDPTVDSAPVPVDPAAYNVDGQHIFSYTTRNDATGTCLLTPDGATCTGIPAEEVPDLSTPAFAGQRPGAVSASMGGIHYTILEGLPPAPASLEPGQKLLVDAVSCEVSAERDVTCTSGDTSFTISGADQRIIA